MDTNFPLFRGGVQLAPLPSLPQLSQPRFQLPQKKAWPGLPPLGGMPTDGSMSDIGPFGGLLRASEGSGIPQTAPNLNPPAPFRGGLLGASMSAEGGADAAPAAASSPTPPKPAFFAKNGAWKGVLADVLGSLGDSLSVANGGQATYLPNKLRTQQQAAEWKRRDAERQQDRAWAVEDRDHKDNAPQFFTSNGDRIQYDPKTGTSTTVYDGPADFEDYANSLGLEPGTDEYNSAIQDYVLRSYGPAAQKGREILEGLRQNNRLTLRQTPTYANVHPRPAAGGSGGNGGNRPPRNTGNVYGPILGKVAAGQQLTPGEQALFNIYSRNRGGKSGAGAAPNAVQTATDPKTGRKVQWNGRQWVPLN